jgi:RimJ/RimL family protein N-acetyltransferase
VSRCTKTLPVLPGSRASSGTSSSKLLGRAGYHGPPDRDGMVEIGYAVGPVHRRRGYARAALEALLRRAAREEAVRTVRVTISPDNTVSFGLAAQYGFTAVGERWDDRDGLEIIYEVSADSSS